MKEYKVVDLSYSQDARQHLKDVAAYHELDGWRLLSVVHLPDSRRWLYYLERDAPAGSGPRGGVAAAAAGSERGLPEPVRRIEGGHEGEGVSVETCAGLPGRVMGPSRRLKTEGNAPPQYLSSARINVISSTTKM